MPNPSRVPITQPRVPFLNPETGFVSMPWYLFLLSLSQLTSGSEVSLGDLQKGPPSLTVDEINAIIDKAAGDITPSQDGLLAQIAELQKQVNGLEMQVRPELGTMSQLQQANLPWVTFDTTAEGVPVEIGTVAWDGGTTLGIQMTANVLQQVGESQYYYIKASAAITKGQLVMFDGAVGSSGLLKAKPATGVTNGQYIMGIAAESIALNAFGLIASFGTVRGFNTTGSPYGEVWADGDILYYNPAYVGGLTKTLPPAPTPHVVVAAVINAGSGGSGSVLVRVQAEPTIAQLSDVFISGITNGDLLQYDSVQARWENVPASSVISGTATAPVTKTANFTVAAGEKWIINNKSGSSCTVTLPTPSASVGRELYFQNYQAQTLVSASSNVVPLAGGAATTAILQAVAGANATLVSDGTSWIMTQYDSNNSLELE